MNSNNIEIIFKDEINLSNKLNEFLINLLVDSMKNERVYEYSTITKSGGNTRQNDR